MNSTKKMGILLLIIAGAVVGFIFILFATIKTKSTSLNQQQPFKKWIGQEVFLQRETKLFKDHIEMNYNRRYPYMLIDSLHPRWTYIEEQKAIGDIEELATFATGTILTLEEATQYTNGVSGSSYPTIFGSIQSQGKTYKIGYQWGTMDIGKRFQKIDECWSFHQAPWQDEPDTAFYPLPTATFW